VLVLEVVACGMAVVAVLDLLASTCGVPDVFAISFKLA
jgi:hypothetical protein